MYFCHSTEHFIYSIIDCSLVCSKICAKRRLVCDHSVLINKSHQLQEIQSTLNNLKKKERVRPNVSNVLCERTGCDSDTVQLSRLLLASPRGRKLYTYRLQQR